VLNITHNSLTAQIKLIVLRRLQGSSPAK